MSSWIHNSAGQAIHEFSQLFSMDESQGGHGGGWNESLSLDRMDYYFKQVINPNCTGGGGKLSQATQKFGKSVCVLTIKTLI